MSMFRALAPSLTIWSANPRGLRIVLLDANGQPQDLTGRTATFAARRSAMLEPLLTVESVLSADGYAWMILLSADQCDLLYADSLAYSLSYDVIETRIGGTLRWTGRIDAQPASALPGGSVGTVLVDLPVAELVAETDNILISERGAAGFGVEKRLKDLGRIDEATPEAMDAYLVAKGAEGAEPFVEAADASAQAAMGSASDALAARGGATIAADRAELAATTALSGTLYPDIITGLAAVSEGSYFAVVGSGSVYATLHRKVGGAAVYVNSYSSKLALDIATGRDRDSGTVDMVEGARDIDGRVAGFTDQGDVRYSLAYSYQDFGRDGGGEYIPLVKGSNGRVPVSLDNRERLLVAGLATLLPTGRDTGSPIYALLTGKNGEIPIGLDLHTFQLRLADILVPVAPDNRDEGREMISLYKDIVDRNLVGMRPDGIDFQPSAALIERLGGGAGGTSIEYRPASEFAGSHGDVFNIRLGADYRYATVQTVDGYVGDIVQPVASSAAVPLSTAPLRYLAVWGQSNAGAGSGPTGTAPIVGTIYDAFILRANANSYASGMPSIAGAVATDFASVVEPILTNQAQSPAAMFALALARLDRRAGRRMPGTVISTSWQGSQPIGEFFPDAPNYPSLFENARIQAVDAKNVAATYGRTLDHTILFIQGENNSATPSYQGQLDSLIDTVVPQLGTASGISGSPHFLIMQTHAVEDQSEAISGVAQLAVARARLGAGVTMAGTMYEQPVHDGTHSDNAGRVMAGDTAALAYEWVKIKGQAFHPLWPVAGGVTRVGAVITIPMELPLGTTALSIDTDWVAAIAHYGFHYDDDSGAPPAIISVAISGLNIIVTLASAPTGANKRIRYALDDTTPVEGWTGTRGQIFADSGVPGLAAAYGGPATIRNYCVRFEEIVP